MTKNHIIVWVLAALVLSACTAPKAPEEALRTVTEADSVWLSGGVYTDSVSLAQAYADLGLQSKRYPDAYVHACYHYGKLLRTKDDPVGAMQAFINATHTATTDYHILGRVYSNMGDLCHMAEEFQLSYDLFAKSADMFLRNGDTTAYYYALNDMAFEQAGQGNKEETLALLSEIETNCKEDAVSAKVCETKTMLYFNQEKYDSALYYVNRLLYSSYPSVTGYTLKARTLWHLSDLDSALFYAQYVLDLPNAPEYDRYNMFYILMNHGSLATEDIVELSAQRSDIETDVMIPLHNQLTLAVRELELDKEKRDTERRLFTILATVLFGMSCGVLLWIWYRHRLLKTETNRIEEYSRKQMEQLENNCRNLRDIHSVKEKLLWNDYKQMCSIVDATFAFFTGKLQSTHHLNEKEIRLCVLVLIDGFTSKQMAELLFYAQSGIRNFKSNTAKKLGTSGKEFRKYLIKLTLG